MMRTCWPAAMLVLLLTGADLPAQFLVGLPTRGIPFGYGRISRHSAFGFSLSRGSYSYYNPYYYPYGGTTLVTRVRIIEPPPIVVQPVLVTNIFNPPPVTLPSYDEVMARRPPAEKPLPGQEAGIFRPIDPANRARARQPFRPDKPPAPRGKPPRKERPGERPPRLPRPRLPHPDPKVESARQIELGRESLARQEYGRAAERFRLALDADPNAALPQFLLARAQVALGHHRRAYDAIQKGLNLDPDWPSKRFRPIEFYGDNVADYAAHLNALHAAVTANPRNAVLVFLYAYELWFDGRKAEARALFEKAAPALPDRGVVERFLQALPGVPVV